LSGTSVGGVEIAFSVFGLAGSNEVELPFVVAEDQRLGCPAP
jgi:hypothetical protein